MPHMVQIHIRLEPELFERYLAKAEAEDRSFAYVIRRALWEAERVAQLTVEPDDAA